MEQRLNRLSSIMKQHPATLDKSLQDDIAALEKYYGSDVWRKDLADDEAGRLPKGLKRGVLSEDGIWNLLSDYRELNKDIK
jgi:hypothetical protein